MTARSISHNTFIEKPATSKYIARRPRVCGVGLNDATYITQPRVNRGKVVCPYYIRWANMLRRCYHEPALLRSPSYINCIVCDEWLIFSNFKKWMEKQDWEGRALDKDLIKVGNKIYSPETCIFVPQQINTLMQDNKGTRGEYPQGVSKAQKCRKYRAQIKIMNTRVFLGNYDTAEEAELVYKKAKAKWIRKVADKQQDEKLKAILYKYADKYRRRVIKRR